MGVQKQKQAIVGAEAPATEETPLIGVSTKPLSSQSKTFANVFIAIVGAGVLEMPYTFKRTGWIMSLLTLFFVALLTYHCMMLLVYTRRKLESSDAMTKIPSFGDLGFVVSGSIGRLVVDVLIILAQAGFCVGYLLFIGNTMAHLFNSPTSTAGLSPKIMGLAPNCWFKTFRTNSRNATPPKGSDNTSVAAPVRKIFVYTAEEVKRLSPKIKLPLGGESMQSKPDPETAINTEDQSSNVGPEY